jgi:outer membrane receptor protein involved in Fe transport
LPFGDCLTVRGGARADFASSELIRLGNNMQASDILGPDVFDTQHFFLWSAFLTGEYKASDAVTYSAAYGYAERAPLLTELYTQGAFFGLIQNGFNSIYGNPNLQEERMHQFDVAMTTKFERWRGGAGGFFSFINDYVTYQPLGNFTIVDSASGQVATTKLRQLQFINTDEARILGFEAYSEYDLLPWLTPFATAGYSDGRDLTKHEALPGFAPFEARVGLRLHDSDPDNPRWGLEFLSRLVAAQHQSAESLGEQDTAGFAVFDLRGFWQPREKLLLTAGVENLFDRYYREHLDLRTGRGVFQPGINAYFGMRVSY